MPVEVTRTSPENFGVAHGVSAEVDELDRAKRLEGKTTYCSSSPETTYEKLLNSRHEWVPANPVWVATRSSFKYAQWSEEFVLMVSIPGVMSQNSDFTITEGEKGSI